MTPNDNAIWARPGSDAAKAAEVNVTVAQISEENITDTVSLTDSKLVGETNVVIPEQDNAELNRRNKQTDFFNSMSGVEHAEVEYNEVYAPTGLLEVPFNDTAHNLGYRIPKMRLSMSKQTKRKIVAFTSIFSAIAVTIATVIVLNSMFGFIPTVKQVPVIYSKGNKIYLTSSTGRLPEQILYEGTAYQIGSNPNRFSVLPNNEDVLVAADFSSKSDTYSLYLREDMNVSEQGKLIDSNIIGDYEYIFGGKGLLYLKSKGTNDLYMRMFSSDKSVPIERKIEIFGMLDDSMAVIMTTSGNISTVVLNRDGTFTISEAINNAESIYIDSQRTNSFFYIKEEKNTETSERTSNLYRYESGSSVKVAQDADRLIAYSCADNWAYYAKSTTVYHSIFDFIDDDCLESDNKLLKNVGDMGMNLPDDVIAAIRRNHLRNNMSKTGVEYEYTSIGYYANGKANLLESDCTNIYAVDLGGEFVSFGKKGAPDGYNANKSGLSSGKSAGIMYETTSNSGNLIKLSEIPNSVISSNTFYSYMVSMIETGMLKRTSCVTANGKKTAVDTDNFTESKVSFSTDYSSFYYISSLKSSSIDDANTDTPATLEETTQVNVNARSVASDAKSDSGDLMCVNLEGQDTSAQPVAVDVEEFGLLFDGTIIYVNSDRTAYVGAVAIANRVSKISINQSKNAVAVLCESGDTGARLMIYKDGATKVLADNVNSVVFNNDTSVSFVKDFDKVKARGDLYVCKNFGTPSRIDSSVSAIVEYPY